MSMSWSLTSMSSEIRTRKRTPRANPAVMDSDAMESVSSPLASDSNEVSHAEPMNVDSEPMEPIRELSPPPPKVKMSLKDFALRKKKKREEEMAKAVCSPATPDGPGPPSSPICVDRESDIRFW